jgi:hypothetical protein
LRSTVGWGGTSVVVGTSGEGAIVVVVVGRTSVVVGVGFGPSLDAGTPSVGDPSVGPGSFTVDKGSFASETGVPLGTG